MAARTGRVRSSRGFRESMLTPTESTPAPPLLVPPPLPPSPMPFIFRIPPLPLPLFSLVFGAVPVLPPPPAPPKNKKPNPSPIISPSCTAPAFPLSPAPLGPLHLLPASPPPALQAPGTYVALPMRYNTRHRTVKSCKCNGPNRGPCWQQGCVA